MQRHSPFGHVDVECRSDRENELCAEGGEMGHYCVFLKCSHAGCIQDVCVTITLIEWLSL